MIFFQFPQPVLTLFSLVRYSEGFFINYIFFHAIRFRRRKESKNEWFTIVKSEKRVKEVLTCRFINNRENVLLLGPPGVGKTHLSIAFSSEAIMKGYTALFLRADDSINECKKAHTKELLNRVIKR